MFSSIWRFEGEMVSNIRFELQVVSTTYIVSIENLNLRTTLSITMRRSFADARMEQHMGIERGRRDRLGFCCGHVDYEFPSHPPENVRSVLLHPPALCTLHHLLRLARRRSLFLHDYPGDFSLCPRSTLEVPTVTATSYITCRTPPALRHDRAELCQKSRCVLRLKLFDRASLYTP